MRTIAIASGKGGVGKTNLSVNIAVALAKMRESVMLMDADLGLANVDVLLGKRPKQNLSHVISGECALTDIICDGPHGLRWIPASSGVTQIASLSALESTNLVSAFDEVEAQADTFIVDTGAGVHESVLTFCSAVKEVVVVICDEPTSITDAYALIKVLNQGHGVDAFHVIVNMVDSLEQGQRVFDMFSRVVNRFLPVHLNYLGAVYNDNYLKKAVNLRRPVVEAYPVSKAALRIEAIAKTIAKLRPSRAPSGGVEFFVQRLIKSKASSSLDAVRT